MVDEVDTASGSRGGPIEVAVTVPSAFGQTTRERFCYASESCNFGQFKLVDRNLAAALSQLKIESLEGRPTLRQPQGYWLVLSITDLSLEVSLLAVSSRRVQMLSVASERKSGLPRWRKRLRRWLAQKTAKVDASNATLENSRFELNEKIDEAIDRIANQDDSSIKFRLGERTVKAHFTTNTLITSCMDLIQRVGELLALVLSESGVDGEDISCCMTIGSLARTQPIENMLRNCGIERNFVPLSQSDLAVGAALLPRLSSMACARATSPDSLCRP